MKKLIKTFITAACGFVLLSNSLSAAPLDSKTECKNNSCENFKVGMYRVKNTLTMNLLLEKSKGERVTIKLKNEKGTVLHEEVVKKSIDKYGCKLNFSEVNDGNYILEISDENEKIVKNISLATSEVREMNGRTLVAMN